MANHTAAVFAYNADLPQGQLNSIGKGEKIMPGKLICAYSFLCIGLLAANCTAQPQDTTSVNTVDVKVDAGDIKGDISRMLTGINIVFSHETDSLWADGKIAEYLKDVRAGTLRFPGGERVDFYHYFYPNHPNSMHVDSDPWQTDPNAKDYSGTDQTSSEFMDVDEYMYWCRKIGAEPMLGINMESALIFDRVNDGIKEAVDIVTYCNVTKDYNVKYWYLSNEPHFTGENSHYHGWTLEQYADQVNKYGKSMRAVDPNIKLIVNWHSNLGEPNCLAQWQYLLKTAGNYFDIADVHWYWAWGHGTWDLWLNENPMTIRGWCRHCPEQRYLGSSYAQEIRQFHKKVRDLGYNIKLASLEWNVGPNKGYKFQTNFAPDINPEFSRFQHALVHAEMLGQFIEGGLDMACMWPLTWGKGDIAGVFRSILDQDKHQPTPSFYVFKLYSNALGQQLLASQASRAYIRTVSALSQDGKTLWVYLLNKSADGKAVNTSLDINGFTPAKAQAVALTAPDVSCEAGELEKVAVGINVNTKKWQAVLPPYSLTMLTFHKDI
jgi:alpha-N-arabinofuranosidase